MLTTPPVPSRPRHPRGGLRALTRAGTGGLALALGLVITGCAEQPAAVGPRIQVDEATINVSAGSSPKDAYLVIRNNGATDKLVSASSSAGGTVTLSGPADGNPADMHTVAAITVPAHTLIRLVPNSYHLVITGSRPMKQGTDITLTLRFAQGGTFKVPAAITNAQLGGSSYLLN